MEPEILVTQDLARVYRAGTFEVRALDGVSFTIQAGEMVAIMGASGSGKSTLMNILGCLDQPTSGRYLLDGVDVSRLSRTSRSTCWPGPPHSRTSNCR